MMVFRNEGRRAWKARVRHPDGRSRVCGCDTDLRATAKQMEQWSRQLYSDRTPNALAILDAIVSGRSTLPRAFDSRYDLKALVRDMDSHALGLPQLFRRGARMTVRISPAADRFMRFVQKDEVSGCWLWTGGRYPETNYGMFWLDGRNVGAHVAAWRLFRGPVPEGHSVLHECDNPPCANPFHLFTGTQAENMRDKVRKGRANWASGDKNGARTKPHRVLRGEAKVQAKLTHENVEEARRLCASGVTQRVVAERFDVDPSLISRVVRGQRWR